MAILTVEELQSYSLPVDLSGYSAVELDEKIREATAWINGECRVSGGFEMHRVLDRVRGNATNQLRTTYYPIKQLNGIYIVFPSNSGQNVNLPGQNQVPIDPSRVVVDYEAGTIDNWSPFVFQTIGYMTVFPERVPINIDYYTGYVNAVTTTTLPAGATVIPVQSASAFHYGQVMQFYDAGDEQVFVQSVTNDHGVQCVLTDPTQYAHALGAVFGDFPPEVKLACAYVVCDFALRELNPEDLQTLKLDKFQKDYQRHIRPTAAATDNSFIFEEERPFLKEARRLLAHYYHDRGLF